MPGCGDLPVQPPSTAGSNLAADAVVLRIEVLENVFTDFRPASDCPEGQQCIEFYGWARYRARVREVISGDWVPAEVTFARLEHASYIDKATRDCYVILRPASPDIRSKLGVPFIAKGLLFNSNESHRLAIMNLRKGR